MPSIDATWKGEFSNSYVTLSETDDYIDNIYGTDDWFQTDEDDRLRLIITATEYLNELPYNLESFSGTQSLVFPLIKDDEEIGEEEIKKATILQSYYLSRNIETIEDAINENINNIKTQNLGSVQITKSRVGLNPMANYSGKALKQLSEYLDLSNRRMADETWTTKPLMHY